MSRFKILPEKKLQAAKTYLSGKKSLQELADEYGVHNTAILDWVNRYQSEGSNCFTAENKIYSTELKTKAVEMYLSSDVSLRKICKEYQISSTSILRQWIKRYNSHKEFITRRSGGIPMTKSRKTTENERIEIVRYCLEHDKNYSKASEVYQVSYDQIYNWVKKYLEMGDAGLEDRRGKRIVHQTPRTKEEDLQSEIAKLKKELYLSKIECDLLKKAQELERSGV